MGTFQTHLPSLVQRLLHFDENYYVRSGTPLVTSGTEREI